MRRYLLFYFLSSVSLLAGSCFCFSQSPELSFKRITNEQGLSNSTIEAIIQDNRGFMWFGTRDGLNRFDGYQMVVHRYSAADSASISDNYIRCLYQDKAGNIWVGTSNGLNKFDPKTNIFTRYKHNPDNSNSISNNTVTGIHEDEQGNLWVTTWNGLNRFKQGDQSFTHFSNKASGNLIANQLNCLFQDKQGRLWIGSENGLYLFNRTNNTLQFYHDLPGRASSKTSNSLRVIREDGKGNLWLGTEDNGLMLFQPDTKTYKWYYHIEKDSSSLGSDLVRTLLTDKKGNLWVGGINAGLNLFRPENASFVHFQNEPANLSSLSQRTVSALFEDKQGNLWVGTHRGGVNLYTPNGQKFRLYRQETKTNSLSYNDVKCFFEDREGKIWIGTDGGGLNQFDPVANRYIHYRYSPFNQQSIGSDEILHVTEDSEGNLWVSTWGGGLNLLNRKTGTFTRFLHNAADNQSISSNYVQKVFEDDQKNIWVATYYGGLNVFDRNTKTFRRVETDMAHLSYVMGNNFVSICQDKKGNLWFGTDDGGLNCYERNTDKFIHYFVNGENRPDLRVLFIDSKERLWVGQNGLYLFDAAQKKFSLFTEKAGLATEFIKGLAEDGEGNFWITTSNGLTRFNPQTGAFKKYNTADGLQGLEFEANAYLKTRSGQLFFGGINGFNAFYPKDIETNKFIPPVYITDFQVFSKRIVGADSVLLLRNDISAAKEITLSHTQSTFSFGFAALNYITPENNQYTYRLKGLSETWSPVSKERKATYTNLAPGTYFFEVKASNNDDIWNEKPASIKITITPPFWNTWWFKTAIAIALGVAVFIFLYYKRRYELQKLEEKKRDEIQQMQLQFFTNISHEFRTPLSLILGPLEKLQKEDTNAAFTPYYQTMHRNASRLTGLINELMDFRKVESGALKLKVMPGNLDLFLHEIAEEFKSLAEEKNIHFSVNVLNDFPQLWFDRQVLEKIIINLLSNSFKYSAGGGAITVRAAKTLQQLKSSFTNELILKNDYIGKDYVYIQVADNGIGISKESIKHLFERYYKITESHQGSGVGLAFVKSLALLHKGNIYVCSERHKGTEIIIGLPVSKDDYSADETWFQNGTASGAHIESMDYRYEPHLLSATEDMQAAGDESPAMRKLVLIVDDNEELRLFLKDSLSAQYQVLEAGDGQAGLVIVKENFPDLIISDVMMPGMNGIEFCRLIKEDPETSAIPFIMLTAKEALASKIEGVDSGADFYFSKPISINLLMLTVRNIFEQRQRLKDRYFKGHQIETKAKAHSLKDKEFIYELLSIIEDQLNNPELDVEFICKKIGMSRTKLYYKIKDATGHSIGDFVRTVRLNRAMEIMTKEDVLLTEVMYRVGMQTQSYFTKAFKKEFGKTPSQFLQELKK